MNCAIVDRLREIVAEPELFCKTDREYIEDAAELILTLRALNREAEEDIAELRSQRDIARRGFCDALMLLGSKHRTKQEVAESMGWDCYPGAESCKTGS